MMMMRIALLLIVLAFFSGCAPTLLPPAEYREWVCREDNGLLQVKELAGYEFKAQYKPADLLACDFFNGDLPDQQCLDSIRKETEGALFFTFRFKPLSGNNVVDPQLLEYLISGIQGNFSLVVAGDTVPAASCHYERDYGMTPYQTINLVFDIPSAEPGEVTLVYDDQFLQTGPVMFHFSASSLADIPNIQL